MPCGGPTRPGPRLFHCTARRDVFQSGVPSPEDCAPVKLRLPGRRDRADNSAATGAGPSTDLTAQLAREAGKGRPTPKRSEAQGRRTGPPPPPPTTRKEAYKRMRANQAAGRTESRRGAARGDDTYLPARDRGPVRRTVRQVVDSRRNVGSFFLVIAAVALIGTVVPNLVIRSYATFLLFAFFILLIVDSFILRRKITAALAERFPDGKENTRGAVWYGISRATMIRRWRFPKPDPAGDAD